jgi:hypothetical protein
MVKVDMDYKTILAAGGVIVGLHLFYKSEVKKQIESGMAYVGSGKIGEYVFDATRKPGTNAPNSLGKFFDWVVGIEYGKDY